MLLPIAPDEPERLRELIAEGLEADLLLLTGGVSMGKYDLVEQALLELKAEFFFTGAKIQPGKPIVFGRIPDGASLKYFFGLPGNPVSHDGDIRTVRPADDRSVGGNAATKADLPASQTEIRDQSQTWFEAFPAGRPLWRVREAEVELARWHGSGDIAATARANCYIVVDGSDIAAGEWVPVLRTGN